MRGGNTANAHPFIGAAEGREMKMPTREAAAAARVGVTPKACFQHDAVRDRGN